MLALGDLMLLMEVIFRSGVLCGTGEALRGFESAVLIMIS